MQAPTPEEAAAVIAALESFLRETTLAPPTSEQRESEWLRVARREAVDREPLL